MAEWQIGHRKSSLVLSARIPVVKWRSRSVVKSALFRSCEFLVVITRNDGNCSRNFVQFRHFRTFMSRFSVFLTYKQLLLYCFRGKVVLEPLDKILWCGQSNESSLVELANGAICFFFFCFFNVFGKLNRDNLLNDFDKNQFWQWRG